MFLFELAKLRNRVVVAFVVTAASAPILAVAMADFVGTVRLEGHALVGPVRVFCARVPFCAPVALLLLSRSTSDLAGFAFGFRGRIAILAGDPVTAAAISALVFPSGSAAVCLLCHRVQKLTI